MGTNEKSRGLESRIKEFYEDRTKQFLTRRMITIIRLDGKGFSKFTKNLTKPFDDGFSDDMDRTAAYLCENIQGAKFAYTQSDEISVVLTDFDTLETDAWYDYNVQKMTSIAASLATARFNELRMFRYFAGPDFNVVTETDHKLRNIGEHFKVGVNLEDRTDDIASFTNYLPLKSRLAFFDARVFQVPNVDEMVNTMIWRQQDCTRNSISMAASAHFSHSLLEGKSGDEKQDMLFTERSINWNDYKPKYKRGSVIRRIEVELTGQNGPVKRNRWLADENTPIFTQDREYLSKLIDTSNI